MVIVILAAGYATRLYPLTKDRPKALLEIAGRPLLDHLMEKARSAPGVKEAVLVTNNRFARAFEEWAAARSFGFPLAVLNDGTNSNDDRLGAIGDLQFAIDRRAIRDDLLVLASDNLFEGDLGDFIRFARAHTGAGAIGVSDLKDPRIGAKKYGMIVTDAASRITEIQEKPDAPRSSLASMGIYYFPASSLGYIREYLASGERKDAPGFYATWLLGRLNIFAYPFSGRWYDIGSFDQLEEARTDYRA
jgi:glucose-1-phosphate thymidylyltransferase